jgi:hypothetical protein
LRLEFATGHTIEKAVRAVGAKEQPRRRILPPAPVAQIFSVPLKNKW